MEKNGPLDETFAKELYHVSVKSGVDMDEQNKLYARLGSLPLTVKVTMVRSLWSIAAADKQIHPEERKVIQSAMLAMGVDNEMLSNKAI